MLAQRKPTSLGLGEDEDEMEDLISSLNGDATSLALTTLQRLEFEPEPDATGALEDMVRAGLKDAGHDGRSMRERASLLQTAGAVRMGWHRQKQSAEARAGEPVSG